MNGVVQRRLIYLLLALGLMLGGCSGGDSDAVEGGVSYTGSTDPATVTGSNATTLGASALGSRDTEILLATPTAASTTRNTPSALTVARALAQVHAATRSRLAVNGGFVGAAEVENCPGGGTVNSVGDADSASVTYRDCVINGVTVDGEALLNGDADSLVLTFTRFRLTATGMDLEFGGSITAQSVNDDTFRVTLNAVVRDHIVDITARFDDLEVVTVDNPDGSQSVDMSGRLYHSLEGYVDFETLESLQFVDNFTSFPSAGVLRVRGAQGASILITAHPGMVEVSLDLDGDGNYETVVALDWFTFEAGIDLA